ncbi:beta-ketoacyl-ACP synthase III [Desulforhopalus sp. 52FAK]
MTVYINDMAAFLPNEPIKNEQMEEILGMVNQLPSRTRRVILRNNKIESRHYAIDPKTGKTTHSNAQLTAEAVKKLAPYPGFSVDDIECLACGTSTPDQLMPGHASMVHGELQGGPCEIMSGGGICNAGMSALKYAWMSVESGQTANAVATGSELASTFMRARLCAPPTAAKVEELEKQPMVAFDADFLRWMLSDGAGAAYLSNKANQDRLSLRIDWVDLLSFAGSMETCMYAGAEKREDGSLKGWREQFAPGETLSDSSLLVKQDVKLLNQEIIKTAVDRTLSRLIKKYNLSSDQFDWFLPHYSSNYFRNDLHDHMEGIGFSIPFERWFTNLSTKGNTGAASIYIILEELLSSGRLEKGQQLLCFIPESGRFSMCYMALTVV